VVCNCRIARIDKHAAGYGREGEVLSTPTYHIPVPIAATDYSPWHFVVVIIVIIIILLLLLLGFKPKPAPSVPSSSSGIPC